MTSFDADYASPRKAVMQQSPSGMDGSRGALFDTHLRTTGQWAGASNLAEIVNLLGVERPAHLQRAVAESMPINETSFFRDATPFDTLRDTILPRLIERRGQERRLRIWSAASSTGQEAYSVAMLLAEHFPELATWDVRIVGTDLSSCVREYAERGRYRRLEVNRGLPARMLVNYMTRDGEEWEVSAKLRAMCEFRSADLRVRSPELPVFDLVLLRNVLLYFPEEERNGVLERVHGQMRAEGYLVLGDGEQAEDSTDRFAVEFASGGYFYRPVTG